MKTGYHIQVLMATYPNATSRAEKVFFNVETIKNRQQARSVFAHLRYHYPEPEFAVKCHHTEHVNTLISLEDF